MSEIKPPVFADAAEFFAEALAIELEASERYELLADQMEVHNNRAIAAIFRKMSAIEAEHHKEIARLAAAAKLDGLRAKFSWTGADGPEATDLSEAHYLMTPRQALGLARHNEERAAAYFEAIAAEATDPTVRAFAATMASDERRHVVWVDQWIAKYEADDPNWDEDPDPAVITE